MALFRYLRVQWDRGAAVASIVLGLVALLLGWIGTSGESFVAGQIPYLISGGFLGIVLIGLGAVFWLSADLRDDWRELRGLREALGVVPSAGPAPHATDSAGHATAERRQSRAAVASK